MLEEMESFFYLGSEVGQTNKVEREVIVRLKQHATDAANAREFYKNTIQKCRESWTDIH